MPSPLPNLNAHGAAATAATTPTPPPIGTTIDDGTNAGALQLASVLGYGGYGVVYRAVTNSGGLYAVKCLLRTSNPNNPKQAQRQRRLHMREIALHRLAGAGAHPGIVRLHRIIEPALPAEDGTLSIPSPYTFLVMDYAPCGDLFTLILHKQVYLGRTGLVARVFSQLAAAVSHCHSLGIFHRDLKPENVLCWDGGATVRLADFGLATTERRSREWRTGSVYHMSPVSERQSFFPTLLTSGERHLVACDLTPQSPDGPKPVLPISSGLNEVLVSALDVRWERREKFGVDGLAEAVASLVGEPDEFEHRSLAFGRRSMGMYAPDVVFEGGMARCPWEVGMHIPSGSSGSEEAASQPIHVPQELIHPPSPQAQVIPKPKPKPKPELVQKRSSSASFVPSTTQSPSQSFIVEASDVPPETPDKEEVTVSIHPVTYKTTPEPSPRSAQVASRWSLNSSASPEDSTISEIRFANPSDAEELSSSASGYSSSSSEVSSVGSSYSVTGTPGLKHDMPEPRVSDADLTLNDDAEVYAYAYAASPDTPIDSELDNPKSVYADIYSQPSYSPARRSRYRGRSRARQPYPQLASLAQRDAATRRAKFQPRKHKPELRLNVDLPAFLPLHVDLSGANGSTTARTHSRSQSRSPPRSIIDLRRRAQEESVSSHPFAYSVSQSASFIPGPDMDIDGEREDVDRSESQPDFDVHMISPSGVAEGEEEEIDQDETRRFSRPAVDSESFHTSFDGFSLSPSPVSCTSPAGATEDGRENTFHVTTSGCTLTSPTSPDFVEVDADGRSMVNIERSTVATTSPTDVASPQSGNDDESSVGQRRSPASEYDYDFSFVRSSSPSASSSMYRANIAHSSRATGGFGGGVLEELMDTDEFGAGFGNEYSGRTSEGGQSGESWAEEMQRNGAEHAMMDTDDLDELPGLPGSFPASPASLRKVARSPLDARGSVDVSNVHSNSEDAQGLGLDIFSHSSVPLQIPRDSAVSVEANRASARYSVPPPSIRAYTNSADEALRALHAIAIETPNPWIDAIDAIDTSAWGGMSQSHSSLSTRGTQTFMAITTDMNPHTSLANAHATASATVEDFREYVPYLRYVETSSVAGSSRVGNNNERVASNNSFRTQQAANGHTAVDGTPFLAASVQCRETSDSGVLSQPPAQVLSHRALPKPPPQRRFIPSLASKLMLTLRRVFSAACAGKDGGRISTTLSIGRDEKSSTTPGNSAQSSRPRSCSTPPFNEQTKTQRIEPPASSSPVTKEFSRRFSTNVSKSRTWSFTRSRSQSRRRSRSLSPVPTKGSPRDVLLRLRNARNWFWYALSSMTSHSSSGSGARSKKGASANWAAPYVAVAA
ncbi:hypothetical protein EW145_g672 [Phellinidium pouzarii]|uniref:Protein kinase domain-containing protein n=1 Tax=Phellinidium pouzarii TaxID=167371 RepID=A0A4S4LJ76_9AGAM|nr:hypothetical protein EW145_g672 [Phellinidium pouzarii]